jgi:hypothetical protein
MAKPDDLSEARAEAIRLKLEDILIASDPNARFGTLDATDLKGFIEAHDADLRVLAAVTQRPPHHLLGVSAQMQPESLAAAETSLGRLSGSYRTSYGESHERVMRLSAFIEGNMDEANAYDMEALWKDTESRSFVQAAQALAYLADSLHVPVQMLWEKIPDWTGGDVERAKEFLAEQGTDKLLEALLGQNEESGLDG